MRVAAAKGVEGRLEVVLDGRAIGWAWDPAHPEDAVEVKVEVDGLPVATGIADIDRKTLSDAGLGTGRYGFDVALPEELGADRRHTIRVTAGPGAAPVLPIEVFETVARSPHGPWHDIEFTPASQEEAMPAFEPPPEPASDPGEAALLGERGWLFVADGAYLTAAQMTGAQLLSAEELEARVEATAERHRRLRELRIPYLFAVAPMKERVYGKFLPEGVSLHAGVPARELDAALRRGNGGHVLDLLPALREGRGVGQVFPRTDSNWSDLGAFFAYRELMHEAGKRVLGLVPPRLHDQVGFEQKTGFRGDLAAKPKASFASGSIEVVEDEGDWRERVDLADVSDLRSLRMPAPPHLEVTPGHAPQLYEIADEGELPRAVLVGDSCAPALIPWLAEHFSRFVFLWSDELSYEAIELEMPDIVIHVVSERRLVHGP